MRIRTLAGAFALSILLTATPASAGVEIGAEAPEVSGQGFINIDPVKMSELKGRLILLELFTTT